MALRKLLSEKEKESLYALPETEEELIRTYSLTEDDILFIKTSFRGKINHLRVAVLLSYIRFPGLILPADTLPDDRVMEIICGQLKISKKDWKNYVVQSETRQDHIQLLRKRYGYKNFSSLFFDNTLQHLKEFALQTDKGIHLASELIKFLRKNKIIVPKVSVIEKICSEALSYAEKEIYDKLSSSLSRDQKHSLDLLLTIKDKTNISYLSWLKQSPSAFNSKYLLEHIQRLRTIKSLHFPENLGKDIHQNRLLKIAREGRQMTQQHLKDFEASRRYATMVSILLEIKATIIDEIIEMNDKIIGSIFRYAKNTQNQIFQSTGKSIGEQLSIYLKIGNALLEARETGEDAFDAVESVISWEELYKSIMETKQLATKEKFDYLYLAADKYSSIKRYAGEFLQEIDVRSAPIATDILKAVDILRQLYKGEIKKLPENISGSFIRKRWEELVFTENGTDRKFYELCVFSEVKNHLRSGDIWVQGSRQYKDFEDYLIPEDLFSAMKDENKFPLDISLDATQYLTEKIKQLEDQMEIACRLAKENALPEASLSNDRIKIKPLDNAVPQEAEALSAKVYRLLPYIKITDLLQEVDGWTHFSDHFTHLKSGDKAEDKNLMLTVILSDAINLGLRKMADASPGISYSKLSWLQAWHIRDETYSSALAEIINYQYKHPFSGYWGEGKTSSSDGQRFAVGSHAHKRGNINPKYGSSPGVQFYTHISDQYAPYHTNVITVGTRDAPYTLDGLLYHESDLQIEEHYTDTAGFTDHIFALMHLLGFKFAPRIRDLNEKKLYIPFGNHDYSVLSEHIGGTINTKIITQNWDEILRLATSIKNGTVTASLIIRKIGSYPRQNGLATALRELGKIERTLFMLEWYMDPTLRRRVTVGLNKGEARNALARAVYFNRLGEVRDRGFESQRYRAGGLNLATAAIILWNTVYIEKAVEHLKEQGEDIDEELLQYLSPLGWEHIHLTGDYVWNNKITFKQGELRPLRMNNL